MTEDVTIEETPATKPKRGKREPSPSQWSWVPRLFFRPKSILSLVTAQEKPIWQKPFLILTLLVIIAVLVAAPIRRMNVQMGANIPQDFQYWSDSDQQNFMQSQQSLTSPVFMYMFPILSGVAKYFIFWLLFGSLLHLINTLAGSRANRQRFSNLTAWAMLPFGLRLLVEIITILISKKLVTKPGLSSLVTTDARGLLAFARGILSQIDIYWVLFVVFVLLGALPLSGLKRSKAVTATLITVVIMLIILSIPSVLSAALSGVSTVRPFFY